MALGKWKVYTGMAKARGYWLRRRFFGDDALETIAQHIRHSEAQHTGELMLAVEAITPAHEPDSRMRALEVFGRLRVWDTPFNTGVLLYLSLDRGRIEIIADRGIQADTSAWQEVCVSLQRRLADGDYLSGVLAAIDAIEAILRAGCPDAGSTGATENILPDEPVML